MKPVAVVRGGGDLATATGRRLHLFGFGVVHLEVVRPMAIRRGVSFASAVYGEKTTVDGITARLARNIEDVRSILSDGNVAVFVDPGAASLSGLFPTLVVDATMAKGLTEVENPTRMGWAEYVVALGPGFEAGVDAHAVVETCRGHYLGRVYTRGKALPFTGVPASVLGVSTERVLRAPCNGVFENKLEIGNNVSAGDEVAMVGGEPLTSTIPGVLRGILHGGLPVKEGRKVGDVDPRGVREYCFTISDKANAVAGGVLEAVSGHFAGQWRWKGTLP